MLTDESPLTIVILVIIGIIVTAVSVSVYVRWKRCRNAGEATCKYVYSIDQRNNVHVIIGIHLISLSE